MSYCVIIQYNKDFYKISYSKRDSRPPAFLNSCNIRW